MQTLFQLAMDALSWVFYHAVQRAAGTGVVSSPYERRPLFAEVFLYLFVLVIFALGLGFALLE